MEISESRELPHRKTGDSSALRDGIRILERIIGPCEGGTSDHAWRKCRRCLTLHELQNHHEPATRLLRVVLAQFGAEAR
jgi:hypothetical protein